VYVAGKATRIMAVVQKRREEENLEIKINLAKKLQNYSKVYALRYVAYLYSDGFVPEKKKI